MLVLKALVKMAKISILILIRGYQMTSIFRISCCRFYPSCSNYSVQSIEKYGIFRGVLLTLTRLMKCHPWHKAGEGYIEL